MQRRELPVDWDAELALFSADAKGLAPRASSGKVLNAIASHYRLADRRLYGALDAMTVEVELAPDFAGDRAHRADEITHHIKSLIGVTCKVVVKADGELPRSQGNAVRVIDRRNRAN